MRRPYEGSVWAAACLWKAWRPTMLRRRSCSLSELAKASSLSAGSGKNIPEHRCIVRSEPQSPVRYVTTRGEAPELAFEDALLAGLARDGGLYVPETWPQLSPRRSQALPAGPSEVAVEVIQLFVGGAMPSDSPHGRDAYAAFRHPAVTPLAQIDRSHLVLELFHGPTLAFKDVAMQLLAG